MKTHHLTLYLTSFINLLLLVTTPTLAQTEEEIFSETFSDVSFPEGWATETSNNNIQWKVSREHSIENLGPARTSSAAMSLVKSSLSLSAWAFTPKIKMYPDLPYTITFYQWKESLLGIASFKLIYNSTQTNTGATTIKQTTELLGSTGWVQHKYQFKVSQEGYYHIGFGIENMNVLHDIWIDQIKLTTPLPKVFYNKENETNLTYLENWNTRQNGRGTKGLLVAETNQIFNITNYTGDATFSLDQTLTIPRATSKIVLGNGSGKANLNLTNGATIDGGIIDLADKATLSINTATFPALGILAPNSTVEFQQDAPADITRGTEFGNIIIHPKADPATRSKFANPVTVKTNLKLEAGAKLELLSNNITLNGGATITGSSNSFVISNGEGYVQKQLNVNEASELPIGTESGNYSPVTLRNQSAEAIAVNVSVKDNPLTNLMTGTPTVKRVWSISPTEASASDQKLQVTLAWTPAFGEQQNLNPELDKLYLLRYEAGTWKVVPGEIAFSQTADTYKVTFPYSLSATTTTQSLRISSAQLMTAEPMGTTEDTNLREGNLTIVSSSPVPLPVELSNFTAKATSTETVELAWATASEKDNDYFAVERSADGKSFQEIGRVKGKGTTSTRTSYAFSDSAPLAGTSYYRLRQVDTDGTFELLPVRAVSLREDQEPKLTLYPNPAQGSEVNLRVQGLTQNETATLTVKDITGRSVLQQPLQERNVTLATANLKAGMYLVNVISTAGKLTQKLVIE